MDGSDLASDRGNADGHSRPAPAPVARHHAGASRQRQARRPWRAGLVAGLLAGALLLAGGVDAAGEGTAAQPGGTAVLPPAAGSAAATIRDARERRLRDQQRAVEGRIQGLDRQLAPWQRQQRDARPVQPDGLPRPLHNPTAERLDLERRGLRDRDRLLEQQIRNQQADRERIERIRRW